jgi:hypothetical protein
VNLFLRFLYRVQNSCTGNKNIFLYRVPSLPERWVFQKMRKTGFRCVLIIRKNTSLKNGLPTPVADASKAGLVSWIWASDAFTQTLHKSFRSYNMFYVKFNSQINFLNFCNQNLKMRKMGFRCVLIIRKKPSINGKGPQVMRIAFNPCGKSDQFVLHLELVT